MAFYAKNRLTSNNYERRVQSIALEFDGIAKEAYSLRDSATNAMQPQVNYADGDTVIVGQLPENTLTFKLSVLVWEAFPQGTTVDINILNDNVDGATGVINLVTDMQVANPDAQIQIPLPNAGNRDKDDVGLSAGDPLNTLWVSDTIPYYIAVTFKGANLNGTGRAVIVMDYATFSTNDTAYTGA